MIAADLERASFRRYRRARIIRTESRAVMQPIVFVLDVDAFREQMAARLRGRL